MQFYEDISEGCNQTDKRILVLKTVCEGGKVVRKDLDYERNDPRPRKVLTYRMSAGLRDHQDAVPRTPHLALPASNVTDANTVGNSDLKTHTISLDTKTTEFEARMSTSGFACLTSSLNEPYITCRLLSPVTQIFKSVKNLKHWYWYC